MEGRERVCEEKRREEATCQPAYARSFPRLEKETAASLLMICCTHADKLFSGSARALSFTGQVGGKIRNVSRSARTSWLFCLLQQLPVSSVGVQMLERSGSVTSCHAVIHHLRDRLSIFPPTSRPVHSPIDKSHRDSPSISSNRDFATVQLAIIDTSSHRDSPSSNSPSSHRHIISP